MIWIQVFGKMNTLCKLPYQEISQNPNFKKKKNPFSLEMLAWQVVPWLHIVQEIIKMSYLRQKFREMLFQELDYVVKRNKFCVLE